MRRKDVYSLKNLLETIAIASANKTGTTSAFVIACIIVITWLAVGPFFHFSDTWQLVINTGTSVITFLMVFLIQKSQNKDALAVQVKLNELVAANALASNRIISVEDLTEQELVVLNTYYTKLAAMTKKGIKTNSSHSIEEAIENSNPSDKKTSKGKK